MSVVTLRPDALDDFAVAIAAELVRVRTDGVDLDRTRRVYENRNPDCHASTAATMDEIIALIEDVDEVARRVARFAAAARELDRDFRMGPPAPGQLLGVVMVDAAALDRQADSYLARWQTTTDIREFMHAVPQAEWNQLVFGQPNAHSHLGGDYVGGGVIISPDGLSYPIVIPQVHANGQIYRADGLGLDPDHSVLTLDGSDPGWATSDIRIGITRIRDEMAPLLKAATFLGVATNPDLAPSPAASMQQYESLLVDSGGRPWVGHIPPSARVDTPSPVPGELGLPPLEVQVLDSEGRPVRMDTSSPGNRHLRRQAERLERNASLEWAAQARASSARPDRGTESVVAGGADLIVGTMVAVSTLQMIDRSDHRAYQVDFQANEDGRRRALVRIYGLGDEDGSVDVSTVNLDHAGRLEWFDVQFRPPTYPTIGGLPEEAVMPRAAAES